MLWLEYRVQKGNLKDFFYKNDFTLLEMRHTTCRLNPWLKSSKFGYNSFHLATVLATNNFEPGWALRSDCTSNLIRVHTVSCQTRSLFKYFNRWKKQTSFVVIGALRVYFWKQRSHLIFSYFLILDTDSHVLWQTMKSQTKPMKGGISSGSALLVNFF